MKAPDFWWRERPGGAALALAPLGAVYGAVTAARMRRPGAAMGVPVICVGNLVAGGAGKTPAAIAVARLLLAAGRRPAFLSRGYGRRGEGVLAVEPDRHGAMEVGDEPLLLARLAPTIVAADRRAAARRAIATGADVLVLDDGLQNPALVKRWSLAVADGATGVGNGLCLPAGPLRAPVARQWPGVSLLCVIGDGAPGDALARLADAAAVPVTRARLVPDRAVLARWAGRRLFAFAGIGRPEKFFATLREAGMDVAATRAFADHHAFTPADLDRLRRDSADTLLVTTEKDAVRLPPGFADSLPVDLVFDEPGAIAAALRVSV